MQPLLWLPKLSQNSYETHLKECVAHYRKTRKSLDELATGHPGQKPIHPQYVTRVLDQLAAEDVIFMCDVM
jgi:pyruvate dehydrogenase (quinone)